MDVTLVDVGTGQLHYVEVGTDHALRQLRKEAQTAFGYLQQSDVSLQFDGRELNPESVLELESGCEVRVARSFKKYEDALLASKGKRNSAGLLRSMPPEVQVDRACALIAVSLGRASDVGKELWADTDFVIEAAAISPKSLQLAHRHIRADHTAMLRCVCRTADTLMFLPDLADNPAFMMQCVKENPLLLHGASDAVRDNIDIVMAAVSLRGDALAFASIDLRANIDVVRAAMEQEPFSLRHAVKKIRLDPALVREAITAAPFYFQYASHELRSDHDLALYAVSLHADTIKFTSKNLRSNFAFMHAAVKLHPETIMHAATQLKIDPQLIDAAKKAKKTNPDSDLLPCDICGATQTRKGAPFFQEEDVRLHMKDVHRIRTTA
eukprot:TRINITY_DN4357_c0_g6_i1.p1 TRINITY_DN4357_c0_g6~~TRINITY_DN4357_c0_g6_i1.p1  ORF type:complete len:381 (+),score=109.08 TRINITY_DN4357_c0_g6_i1:2960-4102(+)